MKKGSFTSKLEFSFFLLSKPRLLRRIFLLQYAEFHYCRSMPLREIVKQSVLQLKRYE
jgi:hypothetical protein